MVVEWTTADATTPVVMYGTTNGSLTRTVSATTKTYNASSMCGAPANSTGYIDPGMLHSAVLSNLSYNTRYYYQYGDKVRSPVLPVHIVHIVCLHAAQRMQATCNLTCCQVYKQVTALP